MHLRPVVHKIAYPIVGTDRAMVHTDEINLHNNKRSATLMIIALPQSNVLLYTTQRFYIIYLASRHESR